MYDFMYDCFLKTNSQKLRHYLLMTLKRNPPVAGTMHGDVLVAGRTFCYGTSTYYYYKQRKEAEEEGWIDCMKNVELFKALTAVRRNSDIHQWFVNRKTGEWVLSNEDEFEMEGFKKAYKDNLIEHFDVDNKVKRS